MPIEEARTIETGKHLARLEQGGKLSAIIPRDIDEIWRFSGMVAKSGMAPKGMERQETIAAAIMHGMEIGLQPLQAIQSIAVVNGRPCVWGDAAIGLVQGSGLLEDINEGIEDQGEKMTAFCELKHKQRKSVIRRTFSVADAKEAGLWGKTGPWKQYPKRMLQMRARAWALRDGFADVLKGLQVREEVADYSRAPIPIDATAQPVTAAEIMGEEPATEAPEFEEAEVIEAEDEPAEPALALDEPKDNGFCFHDSNGVVTKPYKSLKEIADGFTRILDNSPDPLTTKDENVTGLENAADHFGAEGRKTVDGLYQYAQQLAEGAGR
jgi:hypothetical protein